MQAHGFRVYFTPLFEVLFTFPSRYWFTIGLRRVFSLGGWSRRVHTGFLVSRATQDTGRLRRRFVYGIFTLSDPTFQMVPLRRFLAMPRSYNPAPAETGTVWANPVSLATTPGITFVFSSYGYLDVSVPHVRLPPYGGMSWSSHDGLPHSDIRGSIRICQSPRLFAAYHVLLRLPEPRHPPCALIHFYFAVRCVLSRDRTAGYDKYTLASLICMCRLRAIGGRLSPALAATHYQ